MVIKFRNSVLTIEKVSHAYWGVSNRFSDDIAFYFGYIYVLYWWRTPNKACSRLKLLVGKIIKFCATRFSG